MISAGACCLSHILLGKFFPMPRVTAAGHDSGNPSCTCGAALPRERRFPRERSKIAPRAMPVAARTRAGFVLIPPLYQATW